MYTADDVLECWNNSFHSNFFPQFADEAGQEYLLSLSGYVISCGAGKTISQNCPDVFCCFVPDYMAWLLATWAKAEISDGSVVLPEPSASEPFTYLKKKTIGGKTCEWAVFQEKNSACRDCSDNNVAHWKSSWMRCLQDCEDAQVMPFIAGGSYMPPARQSGCCGVDKWRV